GGGRIDTVLAPDDPALPAALAPLENLLTRRILPEPRVAVATLNGRPAGESPFLPLLRQLFEAVRERNALTLFKGRGPVAGAGS
ncbi:MAG TPA: hypothetical protein PKD41_08295, partial [Solidesulfovibrio sp.]|nr:hypothetical protein [Desulfovibrio sp.]HML60878.1 hypothetical protein [Solidesulfovibrio sp.]